MVPAIYGNTIVWEDEKEENQKKRDKKIEQRKCPDAGRDRKP